MKKTLISYKKSQEGDTMKSGNIYTKIIKRNQFSNSSGVEEFNERDEGDECNRDHQ